MTNLTVITDLMYLTLFVFNWDIDGILRFI
jgi:hypothetical protein